MAKAKGKRIKSSLLSVNLGSHSVKLVEGVHSGERLKITNMALVQIDNKVYEDGVIHDELALKHAITSAMKAHKFRNKNVVLTFESSEIIKREMLIPKVDPQDQMEMIRYEVGEYLPIDTSTYVLQYKVLEDVETESGLKTKVLLGAMPKDMVESHMKLLESCGLNPKILDMQTNAAEKLAQWISKSNRYDALKTFAYIDLGHKIINITLLENNAFKFNRLVKLGGFDYDRILMETLSLDREDAEIRKMNTSVMDIVQAYESPEFQEMDAEKKEVIQETIDFLENSVVEIRKVFKYYTSRESENAIDKVLLYGGGAGLKDMTLFLKDRLELPVETFKFFDGVEITAKCDGDEYPKFVSAIGALIRI